MTDCGFWLLASGFCIVIMVIEKAAEPPAPGNKRRVAKNASIYLVSQVMTWVVTLVSIGVIPRILGAATLGKLAYVGQVFGLVMTFFQFGIDAYLIKEIGRDARQTERLVRALFGLRLAISLPTALIVWVVLARSQPDPIYWRIFLVSLPGIPLSYLIAATRAVFAGSERAKRVVLLDIMAATLPLCSIPFLVTGHTLRNVTALTVAPLLSVFVTFFFTMRWLRASIRIRPMIDLPFWRELIRGGLPFFVNGFVLTLYGFISYAQLKHYADDAALGVYSQAQKLFGTFLFIPTALGAALLPSLARMAQASQTEFKRMQAQVLSLLILLGLPMTASVILLARPLSLLIYRSHEGTEFASMPLTLQVYALVIIPMYVVSTMYQFLVAQNRNGLWSGFLVASVGIYALVSMFLIPYFRDHYQAGAIGAVMATLIAETSSMLFAFVLLKTNPFDRETLSRVFRASLATLAMAIVIAFVTHLFYLLPQTTQIVPLILAIELLLCAGLGAGTFAIWGWILHILSAEEQEKVAGLVRRKLGRKGGKARNDQ